MNWETYHRRGDVLRAVIDEADRRRDGVLPMQLPGVAETFGDELSLVAALQLRWHTRLAGTIERELMEQPMDLECAVMSAWRRTEADLPGVLAILDAYSADPTSEEMATALSKAHRTTWTLMAAMSGKASMTDHRAEAVGRLIEQRARAAYRPTPSQQHDPALCFGSRAGSLLSRVKAHLAA